MLGIAPAARAPTIGGFAARYRILDDDRTVYLDALCSNALATLTLTLSDPATDRTFLAESLAVKVVDTAVGEHWRVRSATDTLSWDFSDAPEDVYAYLWRPNADSTFGDLVGFTLDKTPSLSLDLPPGDYLLDFYFPRVYDGGSWAAWSTNYLHVVHTEVAEPRHERLVGSETRARFSLTADSTPIADWSISPVVSGGPTLHRTDQTQTGSSSSISGADSVWLKAGSTPGVYTLTATHPACPASTTNAQFVVARVTTESLRYNWDQSSSATDGINLRGGPKPADAFDLTVGEWVRGGQNLPACYATNVTPVVEARFTVEPDAVTNCELRATGGPFGGIAATNIAFSGGDSGVVRLSMSGTTGSLVGRYGYDLVWMCDSLDADTFPEEGFAETTNLVAYTIFREPLSPWTNEWTNVQNAWTNALEFALVTAGADGSNSETNALAAITQHLFSGHGLVYDTTEGRPTYVTNSIFRLSSYIGKIGNGDTNRLTNVVNCVDQASGVSSFGALLGIDNNIQMLEPFGYLNVVNLVGIGSCNNPFFTSPGTSRTNAVEGVDDSLRTSFVRHFYVKSHSVIFDACAGPALGTTNNIQYLSETVDKSTPAEKRPPRYGYIECGLDSRTLNVGRFGQIE